MAWMADGTEGHRSGAAANEATTSSDAPHMPGMATGDDLQRLDSADGRAAEVLWLQLMIRHHRAGVDMAQAVLSRGSHPDVRRLAQSMVTAQRSEIDQLQQLLKDPNP